MNIAKINIVVMKVIVTLFPACIICIKNSRTKAAFNDAMARAAQILKIPRSTLDIATVMPVSTNNKNNMNDRPLYDNVCS